VGYLKTIPSRSFHQPGATPAARAAGHFADIEAHDASLHKAGAAFFFLLVFTFLLLVRPHELARAGQNIPWAQMVAILAIGSYAIARFQASLPFIWTKEVFLILGLTFLFTAGVPFAFWRSYALKFLTDDWLKTVIIFFLLTQTVYTLDRARKLMWVMILSVTIVMVYTILNPAGFNYTSSDGRLTGANRGFLSGNSLGVAVATTLPFLVMFLVRSRSWIRTAVLVGTFGMMMWVLVQTASRSNLLEVMLSLGLIYFYMLRRSIKARMLGVVFAVSLLVFVLAAPGIFWSRISTLYSAGLANLVDSDTAVSSASASEAQRKKLFWRSVSYTLESPLLGCGIGNFEKKSGTTEEKAAEWMGTHNTFTQISSETGIPALILFLMLIFTIIRKMREIIRTTEQIPELQELRLFAYSTLISVYCFCFAGFFAHLAYDYYFYYLAGISVAVYGTFERHMKKAGVASPAKSAPAGEGRLRSGRRGFRP
jgi:O-antigen ligase